MVWFLDFFSSVATIEKIIWLFVSLLVWLNKFMNFKKNVKLVLHSWPHFGLLCHDVLSHLYIVSFYLFRFKEFLHLYSLGILVCSFLIHFLLCVGIRFMLAFLRIG